MRARTHVWLADRALDIVAADPRTSLLAELGKQHRSELWLGSSWLPDVIFGDVNTAHACHDMSVKESGALPSRIVQLFETAVAHVNRDDTPFTKAQTVLAFSALGHYVADANCPLHVDPRLAPRGTLPTSLHAELESAWEDWFRDGKDGTVELRIDGDSPLSIVPATAATLHAASRAASSNRARAACRVIERTRRLSVSRIPDGCTTLDQLRRQLGPRGLEMLAAESFANAAADIAAFWRAAWLGTVDPGVRSAEAETATAGS